MARFLKFTSENAYLGILRCCNKSRISGREGLSLDHGSGSGSLETLETIPFCSTVRVADSLQRRTLHLLADGNENEGRIGLNPCLSTRLVHEIQKREVYYDTRGRDSHHRRTSSTFWRAMGECSTLSEQCSCSLSRLKSRDILRILRVEKEERRSWVKTRQLKTERREATEERNAD